MAGSFQIFAGSASSAVAQAIALEYGTEPGKLELRRFKDGEMQPVYGESIRGNDLFLVQSTYPSADNIMELLLMIDAAKRASAKSITVVCPYYGYARQDRKDKPRVSIGAKLLANLLTTAGASRIVTMDLHAGQIQGFFDIPLDNLEADPIFVPYINNLKLENLTIAAPDIGGATRARRYSKHTNGDLCLVDKTRPAPNVVGSMQIIGEVADRNVVIVDDIIDTGGTLCKAADYIMEKGARSVRALITHPILSGDAVKNIEASALEELVVTDTIPLRQASDKIKVLSIAPLFARALRQIHHYKSVSELFLT
jgi:ribose-phosphate pyrophosphokinase